MTPGLHGYTPDMLPKGVENHTPETMPVGVMATMLLDFVRESQKIRGVEFIPYRPIDTAATPQKLPEMEAPSQRLLERVEDFYQDLRDDESSGSSSRSSSRSRSRSRSRTPPRAQSNFGSFGAVPPPVID